MVSSKNARNSSKSVTLGPVETEVMELIWDLERTTVRDVYRRLLERREIAYTTVMTIMSNLAGKGALRRHREGRAYVYAPNVTRDEFTRTRIVEIVDGVLGRFTEPAMSYLVDRMAQVDPEKLAELEKAIASRRKKTGES